MTEEEYKAKKLVIENDAKEKLSQLMKEYAMDLALFHNGDIIKDHKEIILISRVFTYKGLSEFPEPVYEGLCLRKDLLPKKNKEIGRIYGNEGVRLIGSPGGMPIKSKRTNLKFI